MGRMRNVYEVFVKEHEGIKPLVTPRRRWEGNIMTLREIRWEGVDRFPLAQDRVRWRAFVNTVMNLRVP
jgi:hypothetical protein